MIDFHIQYIFPTKSWTDSRIRLAYIIPSPNKLYFIRINKYSVVWRGLLILVSAAANRDTPDQPQTDY